MLILGTVKSILDLKILVSLPNSYNGIVEANQMSEIYTNMLLDELHGKSEKVWMPLHICLLI